MIHAITLHRPQQAHRTPLIALQQEETIRKHLRLRQLRGHILPPEDCGLIFDLFVVPPVYACADIWGCVDFGGGVGVWDRVVTEERPLTEGMWWWVWRGIVGVFSRWGTIVMRGFALRLRGVYGEAGVFFSEDERTRIYRMGA
jgi:hypothetical protein